MCSFLGEDNGCALLGLPYSELFTVTENSWNWLLSENTRLFTNIKVLEIEYVTTLNQLTCQLSRFMNIEKIWFSMDILVDIETAEAGFINALIDFPYLKELVLKEGCSQFCEILEFVNRSNLKRIDLGGMKVYEDDVIESSTLESITFKNDDQKVDLTIKNCPNLLFLNWGYSTVRVTVENCPKLRYLMYEHVNLHRESLSPDNFQYLEEVHVIIDEQLEETIEVFISRFSLFECLRLFRIDIYDWPEEPSFQFDEVSMASKLETLYLEFEDEVEIRRPTKVNTSLEALVIKSPAIEFEGSVASVLGGFERLKALSLNVLNESFKAEDTKNELPSLQYFNDGLKERTGSKEKWLLRPMKTWALLKRYITWPEDRNTA